MLGNSPEKYCSQCFCALVKPPCIELLTAFGNSIGFLAHSVIGLGNSSVVMYDSLIGMLSASTFFLNGVKLLGKSVKLNGSSFC